MQQDNSLLIAAFKNERVSKNINVIAEKNSVITEGHRRKYASVLEKLI
jgi:hypothetical protein